MKKMKLADNIEVMTFAPAHDFDPTTASADELMRNGFPPIPDDPRHRKQFNQVWSGLKRKFAYVQPTFRVNPDTFHGPLKRKAGPAKQVEGPLKRGVTAGTETSTNWSGGVVYAPAGDNFKWIEGDWVVPNVDAPTAGQWYYCASWIGIDGDGSGDVFQAGVECEVYRSGSSITTNIYPWWEWYPTAEVQITNLAVRPGDYITMLLCSQAGAGSTTGTVYFTNRTTGASTSVGLTAPSGTKLVGNSAEWIVEAPTVGGSQSAMADYGEVFFSVCEAFTTKNATVNGGTGNNINMTAGGSVVSDGNLITPTIVQCLYAGKLPS